MHYAAKMDTVYRFLLDLQIFAPTIILRFFKLGSIKAFLLKSKNHYFEWENVTYLYFFSKSWIFFRFSDLISSGSHLIQIININVKGLSPPNSWTTCPGSGSEIWAALSPSSPCCTAGVGAEAEAAGKGDWKETANQCCGQCVGSGSGVIQKGSGIKF